MKRIADQLQFSASDLSNGLGCGHLTELEHQATLKRLERPYFQNSVLEALWAQGQAHEATFKEYLERMGHQVASVQVVGAHESAVDQTARFMKEGAEFIYQAALADAEGRWEGRADFLKRVERQSQLGDHSYEVIDTKLAMETRAGTLLQLCLYSDLLARTQGESPESAHVVVPGEPFATHSYRVTDFMAYYRLARRNLLSRLRDSVESYPEPVAQCDICHWWSRCNARRVEDDHLSLVAGISRSQRAELVEHEISTLEGLAEALAPLPFKPSRGSRESLAKVQRQAAVQLQGRRQQARVHELLTPVEEGRGFNLLPAPSDGDLFFDIEGDPYVGESGLEYLFGWGYREGDEWKYEARWARNAKGEKAAFVSFIEFVQERLVEYPDLHIFHYAPYEPGAIKRLMGRYGVCGEEVDFLLRSSRFVDLYRVVRQGLVASVGSYSIKDLEPFFGFERKVPLEDVGRHKRAVEGLLQLGHQELPAASAAVVREYNEDDCHSTLRLRDWLEVERQKLVEAGEAVARPETPSGEASESLSEWQQEIRALQERLLDGVPEEGRDEAQESRWLLAHLLEWHYRESKSVFWNQFRLCDLEAEDLQDEDIALGGLRYEREVDKREYGKPRIQTPIRRYRFDPQPTVLRAEDALLSTSERTVLGSVMGLDTLECWVDIKAKATPEAVMDATGVFKNEFVDPKPIPVRIQQVASEMVEDGLDFRERHPLVGKLLQRVPMAGLPSADEKPWEVVTRLDGDVMPVQGPPGAGKTYSGARMILALVKSGKKVGITSNSHAAILNLLRGVLKAAGEEGLEVPRLGHVRKTPVEDEAIATLDSKKGVAALRSGELDVVGGTTWMWSREDALGLVDTLFVDEAGQVALANAVACASSARNLVLLGDPQQLAQPIQASHPEGTEVSVLEHLLGDSQTIPEDRGLFLPNTYRMHPDICAFISELYYQGRLSAANGLERQRIDGVEGFDGSGLRLEHVDHAGNTNRAPEEVQRVGEIVESLLASGYYTDKPDDRGVWADPRKLTRDHILIVAPFNAQVAAFREALPDQADRIGTVDKFQGQEAPVVIYSMTSSSPEDAPRGMEFLYDSHRFNVAVSRARALVVLVAHPSLFNPSVSSPRQMRLANALARYAEMAGA